MILGRPRRGVLDMEDRLIDVSHSVADGTITYPGLPAPEVGDYLSREQAEETYAPGVTFHIGRICMVANTGTYLDAPFHRFADGLDLAELPLDRLAGRPGLVVDPPLRDGRVIDADAFRSLDVRGRAVLIRTGWDRKWGTPSYGEGHPFLTRAAAALLVEMGPALVGIDSLNIDDTTDPQRPVHTLLLGAGIPIAEHLCNLSSLPVEGFRFPRGPGQGRGDGYIPRAGLRRVDRTPEGVTSGGLRSRRRPHGSEVVQACTALGPARTHFASAMARVGDPSECSAGSNPGSNLSASGGNSEQLKRL